MSGRFYVHMQSGRKFCVEPYGVSHTDWGNYNPATKKIERIAAKDADEVIDESNTQITPDKYKNICILEPGMSPIGFIEMLDRSGLDRIEIEGIKYL